jgi:hypothetical protein
MNSTSVFYRQNEEEIMSVQLVEQVFIANYILQPADIKPFRRNFFHKGRANLSDRDTLHWV